MRMKQPKNMVMSVTDQTGAGIVSSIKPTIRITLAKIINAKIAVSNLNHATINPPNSPVRRGFTTQRKVQP